MDISEKYIKMCGKAYSKWFPQPGDYFCNKGEIYVYGVNPNQYESLLTEDDIWLPRQDQLQKMIKNYFAGLFNIVNNFGLWVNAKYTFKIKQKYIRQFNSMEQLWLAFVMYEKHQKMWDDIKKEWI